MISDSLEVYNMIEVFAMKRQGKYPLSLISGIYEASSVVKIANQDMNRCVDFFLKSSFQ